MNLDEVYRTIASIRFGGFNESRDPPSYNPDDVYRTRVSGADTLKHQAKKKRTTAQSQKNARDLSGCDEMGTITLCIPFPIFCLFRAFSEHTWALERTDFNYPDSNIDTRCPQLSKGLTSRKAEHRLVKNGPNSLPTPKEISNFELFIRQFWNLLWVLLIGAATLSLMQYFTDTSEIVSLYITGILYLMILIMCTISWYQEVNARKVVRGFQKLLPETCQVLRDGQEHFISAQHLVCGDIIRIKNGSRVPADARIIWCNQLKLEASSITGEAEPIDYSADEVAENVPVFESHNVAFNGSLWWGRVSQLVRLSPILNFSVDGEGLGLVIRVGSATVIGQIADLTTGQGGKKSRLEMQVRKYVKFLVFMACSVASTAFIIGGFVHNWKNPLNLLANGFLVCAIGMVPCGQLWVGISIFAEGSKMWTGLGLPATVTSILTLVGKRLAGKNVYLKRLDICEALGQVSIIASDKTGTLTKNVMTVTDLWYNNAFITGPPSRITTRDNRQVEDYESPISEILLCMAVCNAAKYMEKQPQNQRTTGGGWDNLGMDNAHTMENGVAKARKRSINTLAVEKKATGSPSEVAMLNYTDQIVDVEALRRSQNVVFEIPFNSRRKWHLMIVKRKALGNNQHEFVLIMKGASEILAKYCSTIRQGGNSTAEEAAPFDEVAQRKFQAAYDVFADNGRRVIGFAQKPFTAPSNIQFNIEEENYPTEGLTFLGICAIMDPPRDETAGAIRLCRQAGIRVFMVTGDHHLTATAIAKQIGMIVDEPGMPRDYEIIKGEEISALDEKDWDRLATRRALVFSRTTPEQKLHIVEQCQKRGHLIAMTGDGVNDAPDSALKKADVGIGMGSGSDVAKQAADVILMDDNFSSIVSAVQEGRVMYENIKKLLGYTAPHNFPEVWSILINFCFGWPVGITPLQILSIDLGTEILPGISMAKEPIEGDVMSRPPRSMDKVLVSNTLLGYAYLIPGQVQALGCVLSYCYVFWSHGINIGDLWMSALVSWKKNGEVFHSNGRSFTVDEQMYIARQATSAWQMGIVFGQFFNIWSARTRRMSIFSHGVLSNKLLLFALLVELGMIVCFIYVPGVDNLLGGAPIPWQCWMLVAAVGVAIFGYNEARKFLIRNFPDNPLVHYLKW